MPKIGFFVNAYLTGKNLIHAPIDLSQFVYVTMEFVILVVHRVTKRLDTSESFLNPS